MSMDGGVTATGFDVKAWAESLKDVRFPMSGFLAPDVMMAEWPLTAADRRRIAKLVGEVLGVEMEHRDEIEFYTVLSDVLRMPGGLPAVERAIAAGGAKASTTRTIRARVSQGLVDALGEGYLETNSEEDVIRLLKGFQGSAIDLGDIALWHRMAFTSGGVDPVPGIDARMRRFASKGALSPEITESVRVNVSSLMAVVVNMSGATFPRFVAPNVIDSPGPVPPFIAKGGLLAGMGAGSDVFGLFLSTDEVAAAKTEIALFEATEDRLNEMARSLRGASLLRAIFVPHYEVLGCRHSLFSACAGDDQNDDLGGDSSDRPKAASILAGVLRRAPQGAEALAAEMSKLWYVAMTGDDGSLDDGGWKRIFDLVALGSNALPEWRTWASWRLSLNAPGFRGEGVGGLEMELVKDGISAEGRAGSVVAVEGKRPVADGSVAKDGETSTATLWDEAVAGLLNELQGGEIRPSSKVAEDVLAIAGRLVELARRAEQEDEQAREGRDRINVRIEHIHALAASLREDETRAIVEVCRELPRVRDTVRAVPQDLESLLISLEMSLTGLAGHERELVEELENRASAKESAEGKRLARLVVQKADALEAAVAHAGVPEIVGQIKALVAIPSAGLNAATPGATETDPVTPIEEGGLAGGDVGAGAEMKASETGIADVASDVSLDAERIAPSAVGQEAEEVYDELDAKGRETPAPLPATSQATAEKWAAADLDEGPDTAAGQASASSLEEDAIAAWSRLVARDEAGLAWHLASVLEGMGCRPDALPRPEYLKALCFGSTVLVADDPSALRMKDELVIAVQDPQDTNEAMLAVAALIRPALLSLESGALQAAIGLPLRHATFIRQLQQALTLYQKSGEYLTAQSLRRPSDEKDRSKRAFTATRALEVYAEQAPKLRINFHRADMVWRELFKREGVFGQPISAAVFGDTESAVEAFRDLLRRYNGDIGAIDAFIDRIDHEVNRPGAREEITAKARLRLRNLIQQTLTMFSGWLDTAAAQGGTKPADARLGPIRDKLEEAARAAIAGATALRVESSAGEMSGAGAGNPVEGATAAAFIRAMEDLIAAIRPEGEGLRQRDPNGLLHDGFLRMPGQRFGGAREPEPYVPEEVLEAVLAYAGTDQKASWEEVFADRLTERSHIATGRVLAILELRGMPAADLAALERAREGDIEQVRRDIVRQRQVLREELDQALAQDAVRDSETMALLEEVEAIDPAKLPIDLTNGGGPATIADFPAAIRALNEVRRGIEKSKAEITTRLITEIDEMKAAGKILPDDEARIRARLARNDYVSAADMIELVNEGESGLTRRGERPFRAFFPTVAEAMAAAGSQKITREVLNACQEGGKSGPFDFTGLVEPEKRADSAKSLHDWHHLKSPQAKKDKVESVAAVLTAIGFRGIKAKRSGEGDRKRVVLSVEAEPIVNQRICSIPHFGSECRGQWRVTVWTGDASPEEIVADAAKSGHVANMAIVGSRLSIDARRKLAQITRRDRTPLLVLDESLYVWLLMQTDYRLPMFFDCTLPFSWCDPYPTTRGPVPVESFYGRSEEIHEIMAPRGSSLVYGGRQLGKSALLEQVSALAHNPEDGELAYRLDFKSLGADGRPERVWAEIGRYLHKQGILTRYHETPKDVSEAIERWLETNPKRRLLLLLDEMDDFLVADGERHYENVVLMRSLMESTQRRAKFVLAGLHDVQRASTTANTPLVHFGDPICVGPFYNGSDKKAARQMVIDPLAAAGYEFAEPWLPLRVLSQLTYYPSLVGVFCGQLAQRLSKAAAAGARAAGSSQSGPPWIITAKDIEEAMQGEEARREIKGRFDITLDLDSRYKLVALILALRAHADAERGAAQVPVGLQDLRTEAMYWWPEGFEGRSSVEAFQALLEEMQGLGVVIKAGSGWKFRSSRISAMIGAEKEVEADLLEFRLKQPPQLKWEPGLDHSRLSGNGFRRSPLNRVQEREIVQGKGVPDRGTQNRGTQDRGTADKDAPDKGARRAWAVFGAEAGGLADTWEAIQAAAGSPRVERLAESPARIDRKSFGWMLERASGDKPKLYWVGPEYRWDAGWIADALHRKDMRSAGTRFIFAGGPDQALSWAARDGQGFEGDARIGVAVIQPVLGNALRYWLKDVGLEALDSVDMVGRIASATGGYVQYLEQLTVELARNSVNAEKVIEEWSARMTPRIETGIGIKPGVKEWLVLLAQEADGVSWGDLVGMTDLVKPSFDAANGREQLEARAIVSWAEAMGLAFRSGKESWRPNPLLVRLLGEKHG